MISRRRVLLTAATVASSVLAPVAKIVAQERSWPVRPLKLVVGFAPGGGNDLTARVLATEMSALLGQQVVVENKTGAGGIIGAQSVASAAPDGYTLLLGTSSQLVINVALYNKLPYNTQRDFISAALLSRTPLSLLCKPALPIRTLSEFIAYAKKRDLNYGTVGQGSITHVAAELFCRTVDVKMQAIHYRGQSQVYQALLAGEIDMMMDGTPNVASEMVSAGRARALAISLGRSPGLPGVPTFTEAGVTGADCYTWNSVMVPAGTPPEVVKALNAAVNTALKSRSMRDLFDKGGIESLAGATPQAADQFWEAEMARWVPAVRAMRISIE